MYNADNGDYIPQSYRRCKMLFIKNILLCRMNGMDEYEYLILLRFIDLRFCRDEAREGID